MNAPPPELLSNWQHKAIYPSSPIHAKNVSLDKGPNCELSTTGIMTKRTGRLGCHPGKRKSFHKKKVYTTSATSENLEAARHKIEVEQKCTKCKKQRENAFVPDKKDNKDKRANIIAEDTLKRIVADMEHQIQHFKAKAYYKTSNYHHYIDTRQEKVDILEEVMEA